MTNVFLTDNVTSIIPPFVMLTYIILTENGRMSNVLRNYIYYNDRDLTSPKLGPRACSCSNNVKKTFLGTILTPA